MSLHHQPRAIINRKAEEIQGKAEKLLAELKQLSTEALDAKKSLDADQEVIDTVNKIKEELGISSDVLKAAVDIQENDCHWCKGASGV